jgi:hypothetical protein
MICSVWKAVIHFRTHIEILYKETASLMYVAKSGLKVRNADEHLGAVLRIATSIFTPDNGKLSNRKQNHLSHRIGDDRQRII